MPLQVVAVYALAKVAGAALQLPTGTEAVVTVLQLVVV